MKIEIQDKITFGNLLPEKGNLIEQTLVKDLQKKLSFTQDQIKEIDLKQDDNGGFSWKKPLSEVVKFSNMELEFLKAQVTRLDEERKISQTLIDLCLKINNEKAEVEGKTEEHA